MEALLSNTFTVEELAFLKSDPHFAARLQTLSTYQDFEHLCGLGEKLLLERMSEEFSLPSRA